MIGQTVVAIDVITGWLLPKKVHKVCDWSVLHLDFLEKVEHLNLCTTLLGWEFMQYVSTWFPKKIGTNFRVG